MTAVTAALVRKEAFFVRYFVRGLRISMLQGIVTASDIAAMSNMQPIHAIGLFTDTLDLARIIIS